MKNRRTFAPAVVLIGMISGLAFGRGAGVDKPAMTLGVAQVDITPLKPVLMSGYEARKTPFTGVHDPLFASALYFSGEGTAVLLITADVIGFRADFVDELKTRISSKISILPGNIMLTAVHNHGGPAIKADEDEVPDANEEYVRVLKGKLVELAVEASKKGVPFRMGIGKGSCSMNINRRAVFADGGVWLGRNPDGPCDHEVGAVKFEDMSGTMLAILVNWPCHGTTSGQDNYEITGDWPGAAARTLKKRVGKDVVVAVTAGASGDINPIYGPGNDFDEIDAVGFHVGTEAWKTLGGIETSPVYSLGAANAAMTFPGKKACPDRYPRAAYESGPDAEVRLTTLKIGDLVLCGVSGELMNEIGVAVKKRSPFSGTFVVTHANGSSGYICTDKAFTEGGYEVQVTRLMPGAEGPLTLKLLELIRSFQPAAAVSAPEVGVQALVDAINAHDLEAVLRTYAPDSVARRLPGGEEFLHGHPDIKAKFVALFAKNPGIRIEIIGRIFHGDYVIDREKVTGLAGGAGPSYGAVVYEIKDGLIRNEWYLPKTSTLE